MIKDLNLQWKEDKDIPDWWPESIPYQLPREPPPNGFKGT